MYIYIYIYIYACMCTLKFQKIINFIIITDINAGKVAESQFNKPKPGIIHDEETEDLTSMKSKKNS